MRSFHISFFISLLLLSALPVQAKSPQFLFTMECQGCHLQDGSGGVDAVPPLNNYVAKFLTVPGGREFLAQVPGVARSTLSDAEITSVLNWLLQHFGPPEIARQYPLYTTDEVARLRKTPLTEVSNTRAALVKQIQQNETPDRSN
jgi:hypothetical protein